jgi:hypothetical protein
MYKKEQLQEILHILQMEKQRHILAGYESNYKKNKTNSVKTNSEFSFTKKGIIA